MGILKAYGDESGKATAGGEDVISLGALIGRNSQWLAFEEDWTAMLSRWEIPYLHMTEIIGARRKPDRAGPFAKFVDVMELQKLLHDAVQVIQDCGFGCRSLAVFVNDLRGVMKRYGVNADPYSFTLYAAIGMLGTWALNNQQDDPSFELILDRLEKGHKRVAEAQELYESDQFMSWRGWPVVTPLSPGGGGPGSRQIPALQAADLVAWSVRFQLDNVKQWMMRVKPTLPPRAFPVWNKSLDNFLEARRLEQRDKFPEGLVFTSVFARLLVSGHLHYYFFDKERLEAHIFKSRSLFPPSHAVADAIQKAGRAHPLSL